MSAAAERSLVEVRRHRQNTTFLMLITMVLVVGFIALGNWLQWWTIGGRRAAAAVACPTQKVSDPELTKVSVYNGTDRHGLAAAVSKELQRRTFHVISIANQKQPDPLRAVAVIRFGPSGAVQAHTVSLQFPPKVKLMQDDRPDTSVDVILGEKYKGMVGRKEAARAIVPAAEPAGCVRPT